VKIRIGYGLGALQNVGDAESFAALVDGLEGNGFDSLWLSERVSGPAPDPIIGLAIAAGRTRKLKLGTSVQVLPGRNPALLAKELASLDVLSGGRLLPAFGLGVASGPEQQAFGVARGDRAPWFDEALPLIRRIWSEDAVDHDGARFHYEALRVLPKPTQQPLDVWLGGKAPSELRRVGRLGDGWLASFATPSDCEAGRRAIDAAADGAGRSIDPEHFGTMIFYARDAVPQSVLELLASRNPDVDPGELVVEGIANLAHRIEAYLAVGFSKFVLVPFGAPDDWSAELADTAAAVLPLQN
jgi:probable F420-dependent oxidoreductase